MLNTKKFKNQLNDNLIKPITNHFQADVANYKFLFTSLKQLTLSIRELSSAAKGLENYSNDVERLYEQWQFKSDSHIEKIQQIINKQKR